MMTLPTEDTYELIAALGFLAGRVGRRVIVGPPGYISFLYGPPPASAGERAELIGSLGMRLLTSTDNGRRRLRMWLDEQRTAPGKYESPSQLRERLYDS